MEQKKKNRLQYKDQKGNTIKDTRTGPQLERAIQKSIIQWLKYQKDLEAEVIDNKGTWVRDKRRPNGGYFKGSGTCKGFPDIMGWFHKGNPQIFFIEVKAPKYYQSKFQKAFEQRCLDTGANYKVCRSLEDVMEYIGFLRLLRGQKIG